MVRNKKWMPFAASVMYRTLGPHLKDSNGRSAAAAAPILPIALQYAATYPVEVRRVGHKGNKLTLGSNLFEAILNGSSGTLLSEHRFEDVWSLMGYRDKKIRLTIPEMLKALDALHAELHETKATSENTTDEFPFILMAGERRAYNANQIYRDPNWRKVDQDGFMRMHPADAQKLGVEQGGRVSVTSARGQISAVVEVDDSVRVGVVTLPHSYGMQVQGAASSATSGISSGITLGPAINRLTATGHCEPFSKTPYHKHVPVAIQRL
jgi:anaerobic selenocysteine-containing dehydrogenase